MWTRSVRSINAFICRSTSFRKQNSRIITKYRPAVFAAASFTGDFTSEDGPAGSGPAQRICILHRDRNRLSGQHFEKWHNRGSRNHWARRHGWTPERDVHREHSFRLLHTNGGQRI